MKNVIVVKEILPVTLLKVKAILHKGIALTEEEQRFACYFTYFNQITNEQVEMVNKIYLEKVKGFKSAPI